MQSEPGVRRNDVLSDPKRCEGEIDKLRVIEALSVRSLLIIWCVLSLLWGGTVGFDLYHRATVQAAMSHEIEEELDEPFLKARCTDPACAPVGDSAAEKWSSIASTYMKFGSREIEEYAFGPPVAVLAVGMAALAALKRRRPWGKLRPPGRRGSFPPAS
jgi:hypothetical protein